jgi:hypothetical protein
VRGSTIQTANASIQVSKDGIAYTDSLTGYNFGGLIPGGQALPSNGYPIYVKNTGTSQLAVKLSIAKPVTNPDNVDLSKVHVILSPFSGGAPQNITLQDLIANVAAGGVQLNSMPRMLPGTSGGFSMQISMDVDAVSTASASLSDIDFSFSGTAVN